MIGVIRTTCFDDSTERNDKGGRKVSLSKYMVVRNTFWTYRTGRTGTKNGGRERRRKGEAGRPLYDAKRRS